MAKPTSKPTTRPAGKPASGPSPAPMAPAWHVRLRLGLRYAFLLATAIVTLHYNVVQPYLLGGKEMHEVASSAPRWLHLPATAYRALVEVGSRSGLGSVWRMYSPVPRRVYYVELTARLADGRWVPLTSTGLPREYRERRSLLAALFWDFKRARINDNFFIYRYERWLASHYMVAARDRIVRELGEEPEAVRVRVLAAPIPPPSEKGDWRPEKAVFDRVMWEDEWQ